MTALIATTAAATSHPTDGATRNKRDRTNKNGKTTLTKVVLTCTVRRRPDTTPRNVGSRLRTLEIKGSGKMKADAKHILRTKKGSASSKKVYLAGFNANEETEECSTGSCVSDYQCFSRPLFREPKARGPVFNSCHVGVPGTESIIVPRW